MGYPQSGCAKSDMHISTVVMPQIKAKYAVGKYAMIWHISKVTSYGKRYIMLYFDHFIRVQCINHFDPSNHH